MKYFISSLFLIGFVYVINATTVFANDTGFFPSKFYFNVRSDTTDVETIPEEQIRTLLLDQMVLKKCPGIVVGIIDKTGKKVISVGKMHNESDVPPDGNTLYAIGSITKVFTTLVTQLLVEEGTLELQDPISKFIPDSVCTPTFDGKEITLSHLASHTSGLPIWPTNFAPADYNDPFVDYPITKLYDFLSYYKMPRAIGEKYEYSNLGAGVLAHILVLNQQTFYEQILKERILDPMGMNSTFVSLSLENKSRMATGYDSKGNPVLLYDYHVFEGAGALKSSANDLLLFLEANLGLGPSNLITTMKKTHIAKHEANKPFLNIALGWHIWEKYDAPIIWHIGGTPGFSTFIGFDKENNRGVVILANGPISVEDIGLYLLDNRYGIKK